MFKKLALLLCIALMPVAAHAHFVWIEAIPAQSTDQVKVRLSFGESAGAGEVHLVEKIKQTEVTPIMTENNAQKSSKASPLALSVVKDAEHGSWEATVDTKSAPNGVQAVCDYGVITKGESTFWLNYYAKGLAAPLTEKSEVVKRSLPFDVSAKLVKNEIELQATFEGKPVKEAKFTLTTDDSEKELTADEQGIVRANYSSSKALSVRAGYVIKTSGEHNEKKYESVKYYSTLTIPGTKGTAAVEAKASNPAKSSAIIPVSNKKEALNKNISAPQLLADARAKRVVWEKFPGFSAKVTMSDNGTMHSGTVSIDAKSNVSIDMADGPAKNWLTKYMNSMVQHRLPDSNEHQDVKYADDDQDNHPLGTKIALNDELESYYRIRDNVVYEVNRAMGKGRFTISVMDIAKNAEGKYLPSIFTFSVWNEKGTLISTMTEHDRWLAFKGFDLPQNVMQVSVEKDKRIVRQLDFSEHKLMESKTESKN